MTSQNMFQDIMRNAVTLGAITGEDTPSGQALAALADADPKAAREFSSRARTPRERAELALRMSGTSYRIALEMTRKFGAKDPEAALAATYGQ